jgi:hypothetical protein
MAASVFAPQAYMYLADAPAQFMSQTTLKSIFLFNQFSTSHQLASHAWVLTKWGRHVSQFKQNAEHHHMSAGETCMVHHGPWALPSHESLAHCTMDHQHCSCVNHFHTLLAIRCNHSFLTIRFPHNSAQEALLVLCYPRGRTEVNLTPN